MYMILLSGDFGEIYADVFVRALFAYDCLNKSLLLTCKAKEQVVKPENTWL